MYDSGKYLIKDLQQTEANATGAFWFYDENQENWSFILETPLADKDPKKAVMGSTESLRF